MWHPDYQFPEYLKEAQHKEKCNYYSNGFLTEHSLLKKCKDDLGFTLFKADQYQIVNLVGPTGVGKTELAKSVVKTIFEKSEINDFKKILPAIYTEIPVYGGGSFDWKDLYLRMLDSMNAPPENLSRAIRLPQSRMEGRGYSERRRSEGQIRRSLEDRIIDLGVKVLIFDEIQHLFKFTAKNAEKSLDILKSLANITKCQVVLIGTYESLRGITWSGQLSRRTENIHFHRYDWMDENERISFMQAYNALLSYLPLEISKDLISDSAIFDVYHMCCGCFGILKQTIEKALAKHRSSKLFTLEDLKASALSKNERIQIAREIQEGEDFFEEGSDEELDILLGIKNKPSPSKGSIVTPKQKVKVGNRKPKRDSVGFNA